ncbi:MAG: hypothetical protein HY851_03845 [candidate division Zixibacteria bacterium]|nr:hypothetical protein [candidate division Zixibacteria bacterium]
MRIVWRPWLATAAMASFVIMTAGSPAQAQLLYEGCGVVEQGAEPCALFVPDVPIGWCDAFQLGISNDTGSLSGHVAIRGWLTPVGISFCMRGCYIIDDFRVAPCRSGACCQGTVGDVDCDILNSIDISDISALIDNLFINMTPLCCKPAANCDGSPDGNVDIADLSALIDHMFITFSPLPACP